MRVNVYLDDKEYAHIKDKPKGYVRELIVQDMRSAHTDKKQTMRIQPEAPKDKVLFVDNKKIKKVNKEKFSNIQSGNICNKCGFVLVAGKCINKGCKKK